MGGLISGLLAVRRFLLFRGGDFWWMVRAGATVYLGFTGLLLFSGFLDLFVQWSRSNMETLTIAAYWASRALTPLSLSYPPSAEIGNPLTLECSLDC